MIKATPNHRTLQEGLSLLEVLITLIVLGMGLVSLAKFQGTVLQDNSLAKARTVAAHLAEEKIDDLRAYDVLASPPTPPPTRYAYNAITSPNMGGSIVANSSTPISISNVPYTRTWTVADYCFTVNNSSAGGCPAGQIPDFKMVTVTVGWTDQDSEARTVILNTIISKSPPER